MGGEVWQKEGLEEGMTQQNLKGGGGEAAVSASRDWEGSTLARRVPEDGERVGGGRQKSIKGRTNGSLTVRHCAPLLLLLWRRRLLLLPQPPISAAPNPVPTSSSKQQ